MKDASLPPLVSVVIPAYNQSDLLVRALQRLGKQTYGNVEVIISDDNSSIDLRSHVELSNVNPDLLSKIRWFRQEKNLGAYANAKFCLEIAIGRFLVFLSHDDWWVSDTFIEDSANTMIANDRCHVAISNSAIETPNRLDRIMMNLHTNESGGWKYLNGVEFVNNRLFTDLHPAYSAVLFDLAKLRDLGYEETWLLPNVYRPLDIEPDEGFISLMLTAWSGEVAIRGKVVSVRGTPSDSWSRSIFWEKNVTFGMFLTYMNFSEFLKKLPDDAPYKFVQSLMSSRAYRPRTFRLKFAKYLSTTPAYLVTYIRGILHLGSIKDNMVSHLRKLRTRLRSL